MNIRKATLDDAKFILSVLNHPDIDEKSNDDGLYDITHDNIELNLESEFITILIPSLDQDDIGFFLFIQQNLIMAELHTCILPGYRGLKVVEAARLVKDYIWNKTPFKKVVTQVPSYNKAAIFMALKCGFKREGINKLSFLKNGMLYDQHYFGLCKE
jgi:RimJ/RimL family protein N-acetyltransferase